MGCGIWLSGICRSFLPWLLGEEGEGASAIIAVVVMKESLKYSFKGWLLLGFHRQNSLGDLWKLVWDHCRISFVFPVCSILFCRDGVQEPAAETGSVLCHQELWETME